MTIWLCEKMMIDRQEYSGFPTIMEAARQAGYASVAVTTDDLETIRLPIECGTVVAWGSRGFLDGARSLVLPDRQGGIFMNAAAQEYALYAPHLGSRMLNPRYEIMTWSNALQDPRIATSGLFIKPAIHSKRFTGFVLRVENLAQKLKEISIDLLTPCIVALPCFRLAAESRHVIVDRKVVTASTYRWNHRLDIRRDTFPAADDLARWVAARPWQPEGAYVCDVALLDDMETTRIVELNPFGSSGLYACDTNKIIQAIGDYLEA